MYSEEAMFMVVTREGDVFLNENDEAEFTRSDALLIASYYPGSKISRIN